METKDFQCSFTAHINTSEAIKKISLIPEWWGIHFSGHSENQNDHFVVKMGGDSFFNMTVTELIPHKKVVWSVTDCHMPWFTDKKEWAGTRLIFDLSENQGITTLHFTHQGLIPGMACYKDCETGWIHWIRTSLCSYFNTGKGRFKQRIPVKYSVSIKVPQSPMTIFHHLLDDVAKFWPEEFEGKSSALNDEFVFSTGDIHYSKNKVVDLVSGKKLTWLVTDSLRKTDNFEWTGTKMSFELSPENNHTSLTFTYDGFVLENEYERLVQVCDAVVKENLYQLITNGKTN